MSLQDDLIQSLPQGGIAWDRIRLGRFTASGISALLTDPLKKEDKDAGKISKTAETYIEKKALEIITGMPQDDDVRGWAIDHGNEWEETAIERLRQQLLFEGVKLVDWVVKPPFKPLGQYSGASADVLFDRLFEVRCGAEVKCPYKTINHLQHMKVVDGPSLLKVNSDYYWQVQINMFVHRCPVWYFASFSPSSHSNVPKHLELHYAVIEFDEAGVTNLMERMKKAAILRDEIVEYYLKKQ